MDVENKEVQEMYECFCNDCNKELIVNKNIDIKSCIYCKSKNIEKHELTKKIPKAHLLPFKINKKDALTIYEKLCRKVIFKSSIFLSKTITQQLIGVYVPFYLYSCECNGIVEFECIKSTKWKTGSYKYEKVDKYLVTRSGNMSLENIPIDTTKNFKDIIDLIGPYDYSKIEEADTTLITSSAIVPNKMTNDEILKESVGRAKVCFIDEMKKSDLNYKEITPIKNSINIYNSKMSCILLPIYVLNIKNKNKLYPFYINGQTGKVFGNIPFSISKLIIIWIVLFIIIFILSSLIYFGVMS